jgi:hypothetical protein
MSPCPWCERTSVYVGGEMAGMERIYFVRCSRCFASGPKASTPARAMELWNRNHFADTNKMVEADQRMLDENATRDRVMAPRLSGMC